MHLSFRIKKSADLTFDYLTDMQKFVAVHGVITQIDNKEDGCYCFHETLKFGFIPFSFTYPVTVENNRQDKSITMRATLFKLIKIEMWFALTTDADCTIIEEQIQFSTMLPIKPMMERIFRKQHHLLFKNIEMSAL